MENNLRRGVTYQNLEVYQQPYYYSQLQHLTAVPTLSAGNNSRRTILEQLWDLWPGPASSYISWVSVTMSDSRIRETS